MANATDTAPIDLSGREKVFSAITRASGWLDALGFSWLVPILRMIAGDSPRVQLAELKRVLLIPLLGILAFVVAWGVLAPKVQTSLGAVPGPAQVWEEMVNLNQDAQAKAAKRAKFEAMVEKRNQKLIEAGRADEVKQVAYTGAPSYYHQIWTSIKTVFFGFLIATVVAVPLGIAAGLSPTANAALKPD